jgi:hypothetical protein
MMRMPWMPALVLVAVTTVAVTTVAVTTVAVTTLAATTPASIEACEDRYLPDSVYPGKDVVWMPTPEDLVDAMLRMAEVTAEDYVIDLGAGDGRIVVAAVRDFGARALGIEYDPAFVRLARCILAVEGVGDRARVVEGDIFVEDFSDASVLTLFLLPELNLCLRHRVLAMRPGTRVVSHHFDMGEWGRDGQVTPQGRIGHLWIVPARVGGIWAFRDEAGEPLMTVNLQQQFQQVGGFLARNDARAPLIDATLRGAALSFRFTDGTGSEATFRGRVAGKVISGAIERPPAPDLPVTGALVGEYAPADWADMAPGCDGYYAVTPPDGSG